MPGTTNSDVGPSIITARAHTILIFEYKIAYKIVDNLVIYVKRYDFCCA
jgi:hypothetical protein